MILETMNLKRLRPFRRPLLEWCPGEKIMETGTNSLPKWCKTEGGRGLVGSWAALGRFFGGSWLSHDSKTSLGCLLYGSWSAFGRLLSRLGRLLGVFCTVCGTKLGRLGYILEVFWWDFHTKMEQGWFQNQLNYWTYVKISWKLKTHISLLKM